MITLSDTTLRILVFAMIAIHGWQALSYPASMNLRSTFAILMFAAAAAFAERFSENPYAIGALRIFGLVGMTALMAIVQANVGPQA